MRCSAARSTSSDVPEALARIRKDLRARDAPRPCGRDPGEQHGFVNTPIYRGSTVLYPTYDAIKHRRGRYNYGTSATPTMDALTSAWTELAGAAGTVVTPSGLAALTVALMAAVSAGDHLLVTDSAYRPTRNFCDGVLARYGVEVTYYDPTIGAGIAELMRPNTKAVLVEAPGSQSFEMQTSRPSPRSRMPRRPA